MTRAPEPLATGQVHVWHARLDRADLTPEAVEGWLSEEEKERAARFRVERGRYRFTMSRAFLRGLLARYIGCSPAEVPLERAARGKPALASGPPDLSFNLSHSGELAVLAVCRGREVGVDVELVTGSDRAGRVAARVLSPGELAELRDTAVGGARETAFLSAWTRKEALLKACGTGIDRELAQIEVGTSGDLRAVRLVGHEGEWSVVSFRPAPGYVGAVAAEGTSLEVRGPHEARWALPG